jgi:hypothetical protein
MRFAIREGGRTVGAGIVLSIIKKTTLLIMKITNNDFTNG